MVRLALLGSVKPTWQAGQTLISIVDVLAVDGATASPFHRLNSSPEVLRLMVLMYMRFPLSLRNVEDLLFERVITIRHETVRLWWNRFGPLLAGDIRRQRVSRLRQTKCTMW